MSINLSILAEALTSYSDKGIRNLFNSEHLAREESPKGSDPQCKRETTTPVLSKSCRYRTHTPRFRLASERKSLATAGRAS
jgi:hypothetical protein